MAEEDLQALRRAARAGDPAARPTLVRALLRAGRPASEAWEADDLRSGPGLTAALEVLAPAAHDALVADLAWLDAARLTRHLRDQPDARRLLAAYPARAGERWLRVERTRPGGPWTLDLHAAPSPVAAGGDARLLRDRWDARCEATPLPMPFGVPTTRLAALAAQLFRRLGVPFQPRAVHRGVPSDQGPYVLDTLHVDGPRRACVREVWGQPAPDALRSGSFHAEVEGLPGDPPVTASFPPTAEGWLRRGELVGRRGDLPAVERAWRDVVAAEARRTGRVDEADAETRLLPEPWRARARRAAAAGVGGHVVDDPLTATVWSIVPLDGAPFAVALQGDLPRAPDGVPGLRPRVLPIGPAPADAVRLDLRAARDAATPDLLGALFSALAGAPLPREPEVSRVDALPAGGRAGLDDTRLVRGEEQRFRAAPWTALRVRGVGVGERARVLHDQGRVVVQARTTDQGRALELSLFASPDEADARRVAVVTALERSGWRALA